MVGQELSKNLLINILKTRSEVHSFIFYGPNGTGKTTSARLFSRAINCQNFDQKNDICDSCDSCLISKEQNCIDIVEIDGATHNGVEFVREINKNAIYPPLKLEKKLYIIDEAHCLSTQSWNALLKLIEEPPNHLIIILITTEIQKIIPTILSRCQKLHFPPLNEEKIYEFLEKVIIRENKTMSEELLKEMSHISKGSLRESLVLLEKYILNHNSNTSSIAAIQEFSIQLLQLIVESKHSLSLQKLENFKSDYFSIFENILNYLLELSFYLIINKSKDCLSHFSENQAQNLLKNKKDINAMINFLATHIYLKTNFSLSYAKFVLLNLLEISSNKYQEKMNLTSNPPIESLISHLPKTPKIGAQTSTKTPLKALLSETISDQEDEKQLPKSEEIFHNSLLKFSSFDLPKFEFQEILSQEEKIIQILKECKKEDGEKYYQEFQNYLDSDNPIPLIVELFRKIHPKYKFICSSNSCLVIFSDLKDSQYFNLKMKNLKVQEDLYEIFSATINFYSISLSELPALLEKKKHFKPKKFNKNELTSQEIKVLRKIKDIFESE